MRAGRLLAVFSFVGWATSSPVRRDDSQAGNGTTVQTSLPICLPYTCLSHFTYPPTKSVVTLSASTIDPDDAWWGLCTYSSVSTDPNPLNFTCTWSVKGGYLVPNFEQVNDQHCPAHAQLLATPPPECSLVEEAAHVTVDRVALYGYMLAGVGYGLHACVFLSCVFFLFNGTRDKSSKMNLLFVCMMFTFGTLAFVAKLRFGVSLFVDNRDYPSTPGNPAGPFGWVTNEGWADPMNVIAISCYYAANVFSDGLLLFRANVLWERKYYIIAPPIILYMGSIGTGVFCLYETNLLDPVEWAYCLPYYLSHTTLNVISTALIVLRLLKQARSIKGALGARYARTYTAIAALVIESALPFVVLSVLYTVLYALESYLVFAIFPLLVQFICIGPELLILRVALGHNWNANTSRSNNSGSGLTSYGSGTVGGSTVSKQSYAKDMA